MTADIKHWTQIDWRTETTWFVPFCFVLFRPTFQPVFLESVHEPKYLNKSALSINWDYIFLDPAIITAIAVWGKLNRIMHALHT